jgi:hypothetical protein
VKQLGRGLFALVGLLVVFAAILAPGLLAAYVHWTFLFLYVLPIAYILGDEDL